MKCPNCGAPIGDADQFCEGCGAALDLASALVTKDMGALPPEPAPLVPPPDPVAPADALDAQESDRTHFVVPPKLTDGVPAEPRLCADCSGLVGDDGYCTVCGVKAQSERDHWAETPASWVGAVCDRGIRHSRNEDGMATGATEPAGSFAALVVCDGVSTSTRSDLASLNAARAARDVLVAARSSAPDGDAERAAFWGVQLPRACDAANAEAIAAAEAMDEQANPPSCTFVASVLHGQVLVTGWAGDSRAYWLPDGGPGVQLSVDDSWATEQVALGVPRDVAEADSRAHAITRWLGADSGAPAPRCSSMVIEGRGGWLLVCSDGLWNYCSPADDLRSLVDGYMLSLATEAGPPPPVAVAGALVEWANAQGGHDNIAAALARVDAVSVAPITLEMGTTVASPPPPSPPPPSPPPPSPPPNHAPGARDG